MEPNHNGAVDGSCSQNFPDFPECPTNGNFMWNHHDSNSGDTQQQFYPPYDQPSSFTYNHHHSYQDDFGHYQPPYQPPAPSCYYHASSVPYQAQYQSIPSQAFTHPIQPQLNHDNGRDYRTPTSPFRDLSPMQRSFQEDSPMQRMQQLTRKKYGGPLAAQSAAAAAADAARTARRISPLGRGKTVAGEETVRDVLHRQYIEQRRQEELKEQLRQQSSVQLGLPTSVTPYSLPPPHSIQLHPSIPSPAPLLEAPATPATPIFAFLTPQPPAGSASSPPADVPLNSALGPLESDVESMKKKSRLKTQSLMMSLHRANAEAAEANASVEMLTGRALHQAASVVQSIEAKEKAAPSSSRKRPFAPIDRSPPALKPGMRTETNARGEKVERLYVLVHHCNHNDPEYTPNGVLMPYDQYKKEEKREDMITFSYSSVATPYEYVDFRVKKVASEVRQTPNAAATSKMVS